MKMDSAELRRLTAVIKTRQRAWAQQNSHEVDAAGYFARPETSLPWLCSPTRAEFDEADGNEFGSAGGRAKIAALHSSSALAANVFGYWRSRDRGAIARAMDVEGDVDEIQFEQKFSTGVGPRSPNVDVIIRTKPSELLAVESKFCESFGTGAKTLREAYFKVDRWREAGLVGAQGAANAVREGASFGRVDAPQLLKHMLGLARQSSPWHLKLLWFAPSSEAASAMNADADRFRLALGVDAKRFSATTYQELWPKIVASAKESDSQYVEYVGGRYFSAV
jgi:hypothetical protein